MTPKKTDAFFPFALGNPWYYSLHSIRILINYIWQMYHLHCCCQSCKVRYVSLSEAVYLNANTVLRYCRLLCYKMCIYDFNWLYSLFCVISAWFHYCISNLLSFSVFGNGDVHMEVHLLNKASVINVQCLHDIHSWKNDQCSLLRCGWEGNGSVFTSKLVFQCFSKVPSCLLAD